MKVKEIEAAAIAGTIDAPKYYEEMSDTIDDGRLTSRLYSYRTDLGLVIGTVISTVFSVNSPSKDVWPYFKDFNLWQLRHTYTGVVGDLEGRTFGTHDDPDASNVLHLYQVVRVIPEHLIMVQQLIPRHASDTGLPGIGGTSAGTHVFTLQEHAGKTEVAIIIQHASYAAREDEATDEQALARWRDPQMLPLWHRMWSDEFIPDLRRVVREGRRERRAHG